MLPRHSYSDTASPYAYRHPVGDDRTRSSQDVTSEASWATPQSFRFCRSHVAAPYAPSVDARWSMHHDGSSHGMYHTPDGEKDSPSGGGPPVEIDRHHQADELLGAPRQHTHAVGFPTNAAFARARLIIDTLRGVRGTRLLPPCHPRHSPPRATRLPGS